LNEKKDPNKKEYERDYEAYEFLGDSVLEVFVISNLLNILKNGIFPIIQPLNPSKYQEIIFRSKKYLLCNAFMARLTVLMGV